MAIDPRLANATGETPVVRGINDARGNSISVDKMQGPLLDAINRAERDKERVILKRKGKKLAAVVPMEDLEKLEEIEDREDVEYAKKALAEPGGKTWEQLEAELGLP